MRKEEKLFSKNDFEELAQQNGNQCISIYIPTHKSGHEVKEHQDQILLKNHLQDIHHKLINQYEFQEKQANDLLKPAYNLLDDSTFWTHLSYGLAIFIKDGFFRYYTAPIKFKEFALISDTFHLHQLIPLLNEQEKFYILSVSKKAVRFFECTKHHVDEVPVQNLVPQGLQAYLESQGIDFEQFEAQFRPVRGQASIREGEDFKDDEKQYITEYFRQVNNGIWQILHNQNAPLVLAGVHYLHHFYKEANTYNNLMEEGIDGNMDDSHAETIHAEAWKIVAPYFRQKREKQLEQYKNLIGTGKASYDLRNILQAAYNGRIDTLFINNNQEHQWGQFDPDKQEVEVHEDYQANDRCLLDYASIQTIQNSGQVFFLDELPEEANHSEAAAVFRY